MIPLPSPEDLILRIVAFNNAWHFFREETGTLPEWSAPLIEGLKETKAGLQLLLLREYHERGVWLQLDPEQTAEPIYSVRLDPKISGRSDACHMPERIARKYLTDKEFEQFTRSPERP